MNDNKVQEVCRIGPFVVKETGLFEITPTGLDYRRLSPKSWDVLRLLAEMRGKTVTFELFRSRIWPTRSIDQIPSLMKNPLGEVKRMLGVEGHWIHARPGIGYQLEVSGFKGRSLDSIADATWRRLQDTLTSDKDGPGWRHFFDKGSPSAIASAYGLRIARLLAFGRPATYTYDEVYESIWRRATHGVWTASMGQGSIQASAWTLIGLADFNRDSRLKKAVDHFEHVISGTADTTMTVATLSLAMTVLSRLKPSSAVLPRLVSQLLKRAVRDGDGLFWQSSAAVRAGEGSPVHTAHAVIALVDAQTAWGGRGSKIPADDLQNAQRWLSEFPRRWDDSTERLQHVADTHALTLRYFTAPWVVIALLRLGVRSDDRGIADGMANIMQREREGIWTCAGGEPIWATHDAWAAIAEWVRHLPLPLPIGTPSQQLL